ncbi:hypothetical protein SteCoe_4027 [Stentor coeruleus]|uniref:Protein kinase domain-containing protein n=1 Tax=Stentor coeruleus TaxID=5963 RepID=A0A1R2CVS8_9CILI|nr:hypothetical protein SteCoe_4027 [Stentor coeruleus]
MYKSLILIDYIARDPVKKCKIMTDPKNDKLYFVKKVKLEGDNIKILNLREMCFALTLQNPYLVKLYEVEELNNKFLFIFDYYPNGNLNDEIKNRSRENPKRYWKGKELLKIWKDLIEGLKILEDYQCAHRDIRPENIIKCSENDYKITNFHKIYDYWNREDHDSKQKFKVTLLDNYSGISIAFRNDNFYYSPEILKKNSGIIDTYNPMKSDVYSLGLIFLHMASLSPMPNFLNLNSLPETIIKRINEIEYDDSIKNFLALMLTYDFTKRPTFNRLRYKIPFSYKENTYKNIVGIQSGVKSRRDFSAPNLKKSNYNNKKSGDEEQKVNNLNRVDKKNNFFIPQKIEKKKEEISVNKGENKDVYEFKKPNDLEKVLPKKNNLFYNSEAKLPEIPKKIENCLKEIPKKIENCLKQEIPKKAENCLMPGKVANFNFSPFPQKIGNIYQDKNEEEKKNANEIVFPGPIPKNISMGDNSLNKGSEIKDEKIIVKVEERIEEEKINIARKINEDKNAKSEIKEINEVQIFEEIIGNANNDPMWNCKVKKCKILKSNTIAAAKIYEITEKNFTSITFEKDLMEKCSLKPSFLKFYGSFLDQDKFYMIIEYVPRSLQDFINDKLSNPLNENESMIFTVYLLKGLKFLEKMKICHCDIKPENLLLTGDKKPKIIDFSSARIYDENYKGELDIRGTLRYLAPEIIQEGKKKKRVPVVYDMKRADAFSLGVTLIETYLKKNTHGLGLEANKRDLDEDIKSISWDWAQNIVRKLIFDRLCMEDTLYLGIGLRILSEN